MGDNMITKYVVTETNGIDKFTMTCPAQSVVIEYDDGIGYVMHVNIVDADLVIDDDDKCEWDLDNECVLWIPDDGVNVGDVMIDMGDGVEWITKQ